MNVQKLTQKSIEAVQAAQQLAVERGHAQVQQAHLLHGLLAFGDILGLLVIRGRLGRKRHRRYRTDLGGLRLGIGMLFEGGCKIRREVKNMFRYRST